RSDCFSTCGNRRRSVVRERMVYSTNLPASSPSVSRLQPDRRSDSHDVLSDHDLQLLALEGYSARVSVPRRRTQNGLYVGSRIATDCRERATTTTTASALWYELSDGRDARRDRAVFCDQVRFVVAELPDSYRVDAGRCWSLVRNHSPVSEE